MGITDLATNSFGQNFDVTMIQVAAAFCSLINGGDYYQPHLVCEQEPFFYFFFVRAEFLAGHPADGIFSRASIRNHVPDAIEA